MPEREPTPEKPRSRQSVRHLPDAAERAGSRDRCFHNRSLYQRLEPPFSIYVPIMKVIGREGKKVYVEWEVAGKSPNGQKYVVWRIDSQGMFKCEDWPTETADALRHLPEGLDDGEEALLPSAHAGERGSIPPEQVAAVLDVAKNRAAGRARRAMRDDPSAACVRSEEDQGALKVRKDLESDVRTLEARVVELTRQKTLLMRTLIAAALLSAASTVSAYFLGQRNAAPAEAQPAINRPLFDSQ